jgi:hypothetical protein
VVLFWAPAVRAEEEETPERGVARVSVVNGEVSVRRGDSGDWVAATVNAPLVVEDRVATGPASRAEVQFDYANMVRLASDTEVRLSELEYRRYQIQLARGTVTFRVLRDSEADVEVSTPSVSVRPQKKGAYRMSVREDGQTEITVRSGEVEVFTPRGVERLRSGRTMLVRGTPSDPEFQTARASEEDDFDRWNERRDRDLTRSRRYRYVHRDIYGAEDLDSHGAWVYVPPYGWVWKPYVTAGWAPYRLGRWTWLDWYGWSWASYDPWGWAPYHYGRWFHHGGSWCWWPGAYRHPRYYWRPGLVAFFGWGGYGGVHVGIGFGNVGWVPLAPWEPYYPWYGRRHYGGFRNRTFIDNSVHITNVNLNNVYRNARIRNGVTAVGADDFVAGRYRRYSQFDSNRVERASLVRGALPVTPGRDSLRFSDREVKRAGLPRDTDGGRFFSRRAPAQVNRVSFEDQRRGMEQVARRASLGQAGTGPAEAVSRGAVPRGEAGRVDRGAGASNRDAGGWRRLGETPGRSEAAAGAPTEGSVRRDSTEGSRVSRGAVRGDAAGPQEGGTSARDAQTGSRRTGTDTGWRRLGADSDGRSGAPADRTNRSESGQDRSWRRFGEPGSPSSRTPDANRGVIRRESAPDADRNWRRFGEPAGRNATGGTARTEGSASGVRVERGEGGRAPDSGSRIGRESTDRWQRFDSAPSPNRQENRQFDRSSGSGRSQDRQESIRINPPIVRQRSAPRTERNSGGSGGSSWSGRVSRGDSGGSWSGRTSGGNTGGGRVMRGGSSGRVSGGGASGRSGGGVSRGGGGGSGARGGSGGRSGGGGRR